jgi:translation initiation factor 2 subunit 3
MLQNTSFNIEKQELLQPILNIGTIGHVAHGKSTLVKAISGIATQKFKAELERNITIKLGYSNAKIYKCSSCPIPEAYQSYGSTILNPKCKLCTNELEFKRHISFIDNPGHESYIATMLSGVTCIDLVMMLVAGNESCPQPQTAEHLVAIEMMKLNNCLILQNKIDLVDNEKAKSNFDEIKKFVSGTLASNSVIIPISAQFGYNVDYINMYLATMVSIPERDLKGNPKLIILRSFDINKPGTKINDLVGGVIGGNITNGIFKVGDEIEIRPGLIYKSDNKNIEFNCKPLKTKIISLKSEQNELEYAIPGGLIAMGLDIDPVLTISDRIVGQIVGYPGLLSGIAYELDINYYLMRKLISSKDSDEKISKISVKENLQLNIDSACIPSIVIDIKEGKIMRLKLLRPVCTDINNKVCISRRINKSWRIIGYGTIVQCKYLDL